MHPIAKSKALENITDREELGIIIDDLEKDVRSSITIPEEYFLKAALVSGMRNLVRRPAIPIAMIKDYMAFLIK